MKMDLTLNNLQRLICHKTQPTNKSTKAMICSKDGDIDFFDIVIEII